METTAIHNTGQSPEHSRNKERWLCISLVALTFLTYWRVVGLGYIWDDDNYILNNWTLRSLAGLKAIWFEPLSIPQYYPFVHTTYWLEYQLWGNHPLGYHLVNVLLHSGSCVLLWQIMKRLELKGAWLAAALFAIHPVNVETVAWVTERKNTLSVLFMLTALLLYLKFDRTWQADRSAKQKVGWYIASLVAFVGAMLSKTVACSLPAVLLLLLWWQANLSWRDWKRFLPLAPMFVIGIALGLVTVWVEKHHVGASGEEWSLSLIARCLLAGRVIWFYLSKLLLPDPLMFIYPRWQIDTGIWWQYLFPAGVLAGIMVLWCCRKRFGRGPLVAWLAYIGTLFPASGFINVYPFRYSYVADHFQYHASPHMYALLGCLLAASGIHLRKIHNSIPAITASCLLMVLMLLSWRYQPAYTSEKSLWADVIQKNPDAWIAHNNHGILLLHEQQYEDAITDFDKAIELKADHANAFANRSACWEALGEFQKAQNDIMHAITLDPVNHKLANMAGAFFARRGDTRNALICFRTASRMMPKDLPSRLNLATALVDDGQLEEARNELKRAREIAVARREDTLLDRIELMDQDLKNRLNGSD